MAIANMPIYRQLFDFLCLASIAIRCARLCDALTTGIAGFEGFDALNGIATPKSHEWVAAPFCPGLEASERLPARDRRCVLATPSPDREDCCQEFGSLPFDLVEKSRGEGPQLRVFAAGIKPAWNEPAGQVFRDGQAVAGDGDKRGAVQRHHARLAEQADPGRALGEH
jgi:hypothetical protein